MRDVTKNVLIGIVVVVLALMALGAIPQFLKSGAPYYVTATPSDSPGVAVNGSQLPDSRYPYTTTALATATPTAAGKSDAYYEGPLGVKDAFTHSPFDELAAMRERNPNATLGSDIRIAVDTTVYRVGIRREENS